MTKLNSKTITYSQLAKVIDHSLLRPELTEAEVISGCILAAKYHTATVCVKPCDVKLAFELIKGYRRNRKHRDRISTWQQPDC